MRLQKLLFSHGTILAAAAAAAVLTLAFNAAVPGQLSGHLPGQLWEISGDIPVAADYDGDGRQDAAIYRPSNGTWYLQLRRISAMGDVEYQPKSVIFGHVEDRPVPGDYDGDGRADITFWRPSTGTWHHLSSKTGAYVLVPFGMPGDKPVTGDYDGDGKNDRAVFRPATGAWYLFNSSTGLSVRQPGTEGAVAVSSP